MFQIKIGDLLPSISVLDQNSESVNFSEFKKGKWVIFFFYPKDDTPGCTKESIAFAEKYAEYQAINAEVVGVSIDSIKSHEKFSTKYQLPFPLLSDESKTLVSQLGIYGEKKFMGKTYMGVHRTSILVNPDGKIVQLYEKVKPETHAEEVLQDIRSFLSPKK